MLLIHHDNVRAIFNSCFVRLLHLLFVIFSFLLAWLNSVRENYV
jgi:hypothetical protein